MTDQPDAPTGEGGRPRFAFVIPVYNHPKTVAGVVAKVSAYGLPVFVVDDGSDDETRRVLDELGDVTLIRHDRNRGKGVALTTGLYAAAAVADWAVALDADGQHDPKDARALMAAAVELGRGVVVGNRLGMLGPHIPWTSRFGRGFSNFWVRASGGPRIGDSQSGYRVYPLPDVLQWGARSERFQWEVEILVRANWVGVPVREVDISVDYAPVGGRVSHFRPWTDFWRNSATFTGLIFRRLFTRRTTRAKLLPPPAQ